MSILRDYLAYAKNNVRPKLSEEAAQSLIHSYVGKTVWGIKLSTITLSYFLPSFINFDVRNFTNDVLLCLKVWL